MSNVNRERAASCGSGSGEQLDDRVSEARKLVDRFNNMFTLRGSSLGERYLRGELNLAACRILSDAPKNGFVLFSGGVNNFPFEDILHRPGMGDEKILRDDININKSSMLTHDVELVQFKQKRVPSSIRFQRFDDRSLGIGQPLYKFMSPIVSGSKGGGVFRNRKIGIFGFTYAVAVGECGCEDIEAASNGVNISAEFHIERERACLS
jgi:hypothetical protein